MPLTCRFVLVRVDETWRARHREREHPDRRLFEFITLTWEWSYGDIEPPDNAADDQAGRGRYAQSPGLLLRS